ncbi:MAG: hypothetical protein ACJAYU_004239 [Bradymonadia bacterium]|jgi:hypothetical protein
MKRSITTLTFGLVTLLAASAFAQDDEVQTRFYDFNDMLIDGEFQRPDGMFATERGEARFDSLLNLRRSFIDEIEETASEDALQ